MSTEGAGLRVAKPWTMASIQFRSIEEGNCLLWDCACTPKGFPYAYMGSLKVNLRPFVYTQILGKRIFAGSVVSVSCGNRRCLSEHCLQQKTLSRVRKDSHAALKLDPVSHAKTRHGIKAAGLMKLDMTKAIEIRQSSRTTNELAADYGVTPRTIQEIRKGDTYAAPRVASSVFEWRP